MSAFTPAGSGGQTGGGSSGLSPATNPTIANVDIVAADTEYSYALPAGTKRFWMRVRNLQGKALITKVYFSTGATEYATLMHGGVYEENDLSVTGLTIYFKCSHAAQVAEIVSWA